MSKIEKLYFDYYDGDILFAVTDKINETIDVVNGLQNPDINLGIRNDIEEKFDKIESVLKSTQDNVKKMEDDNLTPLGKKIKLMLDDDKSIDLDNLEVGGWYFVDKFSTELEPEELFVGRYVGKNIYGWIAFERCCNLHFHAAREGILPIMDTTQIKSIKKLT